MQEAPSSFRYEGFEELQRSEILTHYNREIIHKIGRFLPCKPNPRIVDFGAGIGTLAKMMRAEYGILPLCVEPDEAQQKIIQDSGFEVAGTLQKNGGAIDLIYASNVLEHIEDDVGTLTHFHGQLKPGGYVCIYVPAWPHLYSKLDQRIGHYRRYTKQDLIQKFTRASFAVERCEYADCIGYLLALLFKGANTSASPSAEILKYVDQLFRLSNILDKLGAKNYVGKNIFIAGKKHE